MPNFIFLIGPRAAGKTSCGAALAQALRLPFIDMDARLQAEAGQSVAEIVAAEGWPGFRQRESLCLRALILENFQAVVACGGGVVLAAANRQLLRQHGQVFYLQAGPEILAARLAAAPLAEQRPPLSGGLAAQQNSGSATELLQEVQAVLRERQTLYLETAHQVIDAARPLEEVVAVVSKFLLL